MVRPKTLLAWCAGILLAAVLLLYAGDFVCFEYRMSRHQPNDPLETITFYYAAALKNGRVEVFYDQPQTQTCAHAIFPHSGDLPCWYVLRSTVRELK
jgi:hypothetical protein